MAELYQNDTLETLCELYTMLVLRGRSFEKILIWVEPLEPFNCAISVCLKEELVSVFIFKIFQGNTSFEAQRDKGCFPGTRFIGLWKNYCNWVGINLTPNNYNGGHPTSY